MTQELQEPLEILSAFLDGEPIAPEALAQALAAPGGREALLDFARLRTEMAADQNRPSPAFYEAMARQTGSQARGPRPGTLRPWTAVLLRVAAIVILALASFGAGELLTRLRGGASDGPPRATRVLRFTPGVDWHEQAR